MSSALYDWDRPEVLPFVPTHLSRVLDVGCSTGRFGESLKLRDSSVVVWGVEPTEAATTAESRLDRVVRGNFPDDLPPDIGQFDALIFNDVLEHLADPWTTLKSSRPLLVDDGVVVISLPNVRYWPVVMRLLVRGEFEYTDIGVLDRTHLRFFTRGSMIELVEGAGFRVDRMSAINLIKRNPLLGALRRIRPVLGAELAAQQYVIVATPR